MGVSGLLISHCTRIRNSAKPYISRFLWSQLGIFHLPGEAIILENPFATQSQTDSFLCTSQRISSLSLRLWMTMSHKCDAVTAVPSMESACVCVCVLKLDFRQRRKGFADSSPIVRCKADHNHYTPDYLVAGYRDIARADQPRRCRHTTVCQNRSGDTTWYRNSSTIDFACRQGALTSDGLSAKQWNTELE